MGDVAVGFCVGFANVVALRYGREERGFRFCWLCIRENDLKDGLFGLFGESQLCWLESPFSLEMKLT